MEQDTISTTPAQSAPIAPLPPSTGLRDEAVHAARIVLWTTIAQIVFAVVKSVLHQ